MDDRFELYGDDLLIKYVKAQKSDLKQWGKMYSYNIALLSSDSKYGKYLIGNTDWHVVKSGKAATLYQIIKQRDE